MGLDYHTLKFILESRAHDASFEEVATLGRLSAFTSATDIRTLFDQYDVTISQAEAHDILARANGFCEPLLERLGARNVVSIDFSGYQHATVIHDMNDPLPSELKRRFSIVIDGGTLEHIFDFPQAISNCMQAVRIGGHFLGVTPTNNFMGHGFYQFSPELFFRVFSPANGFRIERMVVCQDCWPNQWFEVGDPESLGRRVTLVNRYPTRLFVLAKKLKDVSLFSPTPQQSDYSAWWKEASGSSQPSVRFAARTRTGWSARATRRVYTLTMKLVPESLKRRYHRLRTEESHFDPEMYRRT